MVVVLAPKYTIWTSDFEIDSIAMGSAKSFTLLISRPALTQFDRHHTESEVLSHVRYVGGTSEPTAGALGTL